MIKIKRFGGIIFFCFFVMGLNAQSEASDNIPQPVVKKIQKSYGIFIKEYIRIYSGLENRIFKITDINGKSYILRISELENELKILDEISVLISLGEENDIRSKIPHVIPDKGGKRVQKIDNAVFCLFDYIQGHHKDTLNVKNISEIIGLIKLIHWKTEKIKSRFVNRHFETLFSMDVFFFSLFQQGIITSLEYCDIIKIAQAFFAVLKKYSFTTVIHRDLHPKNIIFDDSDSVYFIDFDDFVISTPILELIVLCRGFCFNENTFNLDLACHLLTNYRINKDNFDPKDFIVMMQYDLLRVIRAMIINRSTESSGIKRKSFLNLYTLIRLIESNRLIIELRISEALSNVK